MKVILVLSTLSSVAVASTPTGPHGGLTVVPVNRARRNVSSSLPTGSRAPRPEDVVAHAESGPTGSKPPPAPVKVGGHVIRIKGSMVGGGLIGRVGHTFKVRTATGDTSMDAAVVFKLNAGNVGVFSPEHARAVFAIGKTVILPSGSGKGKPEEWRVIQHNEPTNTIFVARDYVDEGGVKRTKALGYSPGELAEKATNAVQLYREAYPRRQP